MVRASTHPTLALIVTERSDEIAGQVQKVRFDDDTMWVALSDGRTIGVPLAWFPRLMRASVVKRETVEISPFGLHWPGMDEDISVAGLLAGKGDGTGMGSAA